MTIKIGTIVGARRWPNASAHPDCWEIPWRGELLATDDPRAWANTIAFPTENPDPEAVKKHVAWCNAQGLVNTVPVLWNFGEKGLVVHWSRPGDLRPYGEDYLDWINARARTKQAFCKTERSKTGVSTPFSLA